MSTTQTRERIHRIVDRLPDDELPEIERFLAEREAATDPFLHALAMAPPDDEPLTPEEEAAIQEGWDALKRGEVVSDADLRRAIGL
jgi:hypothetical protein